MKLFGSIAVLFSLMMAVQGMVLRPAMAGEPKTFESDYYEVPYHAETQAPNSTHSITGLVDGFSVSADGGNIVFYVDQTTKTFRTVQIHVSSRTESTVISKATSSAITVYDGTTYNYSFASLAKDINIIQMNNTTSAKAIINAGVLVNRAGR